MSKKVREDKECIKCGAVMVAIVDNCYCDGQKVTIILHKCYNCDTEIMEQVKGKWKTPQELFWEINNNRVIKER